MGSWSEIANSLSGQEYHCKTILTCLNLSFNLFKRSANSLYKRKQSKIKKIYRKQSKTLISKLSKNYLFIKLKFTVKYLCEKRKKKLSKSTTD